MPSKAEAAVGTAIEEAEHLADDERYDDALAAIDAVLADTSLAANLRDVKALAQRAKAHEATGDTKSALADLTRLRKLLPKSDALDAEIDRLRGLSAPKYRSQQLSRRKPAKKKPRAKPRGASKSRPKSPAPKRR